MGNTIKIGWSFKVIVQNVLGLTECMQLTLYLYPLNNWASAIGICISN